MTTTISIETIQELADNYRFVAFRGLNGGNADAEYTVGEAIPKSLDLFAERDCDYREDAEELPGTCGIGFDKYGDDEDVVAAYMQAQKYADTGRVVLIAGDVREYGEDAGEVIIGDGWGNGAIYLGDM